MTPVDFTCSFVPMKEHGFFWVSFEGEASLGRLTRAHAAYLSHPNYREGGDELLDFTRCSIRWLDSDAIERIREYVLERPRSHPGRSAIVVSTDLEYGLGRMVGGHLGVDSPSDRSVFRNVREAAEWLRPGHADAILSSYPVARRSRSTKTLREASEE